MRMWWRPVPVYGSLLVLFSFEKYLSPNKTSFSLQVPVQPRSQGLLSYRLGGKMRDPGNRLCGKMGDPGNEVGSCSRRHCTLSANMSALAG